ncbi:MAG TPA: hypothetical protein VFI15_00335 [Candidatus Limnocylindrales bacterium]|nr:hypothetical protein [Candidatus Limnocylindrales bacterium]
MRAIAGLFFTILFVGVLIAIGGGIYQAGVAQGIVDAGRVPAGAAVGYVGGYGWGFHPFGFLGLLFPLFFLFLLFGIIRAIFGFGRGRGWNHRHDGGYGDGGWGKGGPMGGPGSWQAERERRMADLHRRMHEEEAAGGSAAGGNLGGNSGGTPGGATGSSASTGNAGSTPS